MYFYKSILSFYLVTISSSFHNVVNVEAFAPHTHELVIFNKNNNLGRNPNTNTNRKQCSAKFMSTTTMMMASSNAPPSDVPVLKRTMRGGPTALRYSNFLKLVDANRIDKVTFR